MKRVLSLIMVCVMILTFVGCSNNSQNSESAATEVAAEEPVTSNEETIAKKAVYITTSPLGNDFTDLIWSGFKDLEKDGWEVKCIEVKEVSEYPEQIRAMAAQGYTAMFTMFDELSNVALDLADELAEQYPDLHIFLLDTYMEHDKTNVTSVTVDPFESSFVAGYVAAHMTDKKDIGWIGHKDILKVHRFRDGFTAGVEYANLGKTVISAFTGDPFDPVKGQETAKTMIKNNDIDIIYQSAYLGGPGVISACAEAGIKAIGVDNWQGYIDPCVFWSAVKSMDVAVKTLAEGHVSGKQYAKSINFDIASGGAVYDQRDAGNIPEDILNKVNQLIDDIKSGKVDVYKGFEQYKLNY